MVRVQSFASCEPGLRDRHGELRPNDWKRAWRDILSKAGRKEICKVDIPRVAEIIMKVGKSIRPRVEYGLHSGGKSDSMDIDPTCIGREPTIHMPSSAPSEMASGRAVGRTEAAQMRRESLMTGTWLFLFSNRETAGPRSVTKGYDCLSDSVADGHLLPAYELVQDQQSPGLLQLDKETVCGLGLHLVLQGRGYSCDLFVAGIVEKV
ncbi:hypothetical protein DFP73DRAFT_524703 [Morchella snyderi]|nr:hypothetical protein DFP73DRAFT_524703 [Morchella snyderi]